jgi:hypothetical protein
MRDARRFSFISVGLLCASLGWGQVDSEALRFAFGPPVASGLSYQVFRSKEGVALRVAYSPHQKVCSVEIKPGQAGASTIERILKLAVPMADRGKMWNQLDEFDGVSGVRHTYYEKIIIMEDIFTPRALDKRPGARAIFKKSGCFAGDGNDPFDREPNSDSKAP